MFQVHSFPTVLLHLDGNAFFASVMQAVTPELKGRPVVIGAERGIATAISYEAKAYGVKRGMRGFEIKKLCPKAVFLPGDYELFSLFSQKMFKILRRFSPVVEEYSIDEGFADLAGLRRPLNGSYEEIARRIRQAIHSELGIPVSVGISLTKSLAKLASGAKKPMGVTVVPGKRIEEFLSGIPVQEVWGIGPATSAYLHKLGIKTALGFAQKDEAFIRSRLTKPHFEIWQELRGKPVYLINPAAKNEYKSMQRTRTFAPPSTDMDFVWAELSKNVEEAFAKARRYGYWVKKMAVFLKTQHFRFRAAEITFTSRQKYPMLFKQKVREAFEKIFKQGEEYRATGCVLVELSETATEQGSLFESFSPTRNEKAGKVYAAMEKTKVDFGSKLWRQKDRGHALHERTARFNLPVLEISL